MKTMHTGQGIRLITALSGLLIAMLFSTSTMAQDDTTIVGSAHDFSSQGWTGQNGEICIVCHTPHNAIAPDDGPLWNRAMSAATYTLYEPNTTPGSDIQGTLFIQPSGVSKLCLSCHDGTIAIDSFGGETGAVFVDDINADADIGEVVATVGDLSNDHPVAFTYPASGTDLEIVDAAGGLPLFGSNQMECATCHDVHATNTFDELLRVDNDGSDLCLTCHTK